MRIDNTPQLAEKRKLYVVVRRDLPPGLRTAQAAHAVAEMCIYHQDLADLWRADPDGNYLIVLEVPDEPALLNMFHDVKAWGISRELFREPDIGFQATALGALPAPGLNHAFAHLPLAFAKRTIWQRMRDRWVL